eukprot:scaffold8_cov142-Skeletonema_marinoi.AAC.20
MAQLRLSIFHSILSCCDQSGFSPGSTNPHVSVANALEGRPRIENRYIASVIAPGPPLGVLFSYFACAIAVVHFKGPDGYTHAEHERILSKIQDFLWVDPQNLLPHDRGLLNETFESLGSSPAACELWIAAMEVAISAAEHARRQDDPSSCRRRLTTGPDYAPRTVEIVPIVDTEGSIRYKRRRRRKKD